MNILLVGPHTHEWGRTFKSMATRPVGVTDSIDLDWRADYRDSPPVADCSLEVPLVLHQADSLSPTFVFENTSADTLAFLKQMRATCGDFFPAPPAATRSEASATNPDIVRRRHHSALTEHPARRGSQPTAQA